MIRTTTTFALALAACTASLLGADPALVRLLPADSAFLAGIHANQIRNSRFGQFLLDQMKQEEANFSKLEQATGFDPRRDLTELLVASDDARGKGNALVVARGRFDAAQIKTFAESEGARTQLYNGVTVFTGGDAHGDGWVAVLDGTTAVAGKDTAVRTAIDRYKGAAAGGVDAKTSARITELSGRYDAWVVTSSLNRLTEDFRNPQVGGAMNGNLMQSMQSVVGGVRFGQNVEVMAEAQMRSEKDATAMVDVVRFLAGMIQLNSQDNRAAEMSALLDKMDLKASGTQFRMSLQIPEESIEKLVRPASRRGGTAPVI